MSSAIFSLKALFSVAALGAPPLCGNEVVCTPPAKNMPGNLGEVLVPVSNQGMKSDFMGFSPKTTRAGVVRKATSAMQVVTTQDARIFNSLPVSLKASGGSVQENDDLCRSCVPEEPCPDVVTVGGYCVVVSMLIACCRLNLRPDVGHKFRRNLKKARLKMIAESLETACDVPESTKQNPGTIFGTGSMKHIVANLRYKRIHQRNLRARRAKRMHKCQRKCEDEAFIDIVREHILEVEACQCPNRENIEEKELSVCHYCKERIRCIPDFDPKKHVTCYGCRNVAFPNMWKMHGELCDSSDTKKDSEHRQRRRRQLIALQRKNQQERLCTDTTGVLRRKSENATPVVTKKRFACKDERGNSNRFVSQKKEFSVQTRLENIV